MYIVYLNTTVKFRRNKVDYCKRSFHVFLTKITSSFGKTKCGQEPLVGILGGVSMKQLFLRDYFRECLIVC